jgi:hypothetical protein
VPIETVCEDYKVSPKTIERVVQDNSEWFWIKNNSPKLLMPTEYTQKILNLIGVKHAAGTRKKEEKGATAGS